MLKQPTSSLPTYVVSTDRCFTHDGRHLVGPIDRGAIGVFDTKCGTQSCSILGHDGFVDTIAMHPQGAHVLTAAKRLPKLDLSHGKRQRTWRSSKFDGDGAVKMWDVATGRCVFNVNHDLLLAVVSSKNLNFVAVTAGHDGATRRLEDISIVTRIWNTGSNECLAQFLDEEFIGSRPLAITNDRILTVSEHGFRCWNLQDGDLEFTIEKQAQNVCSSQLRWTSNEVAVSQQGDLAVFRNESFEVWDLVDRRRICCLDPVPLNAEIMGLSMSGQQVLISTRRPNSIILFDTRSGSLIRRIELTIKTGLALGGDKSVWPIRYRGK